MNIRLVLVLSAVLASACSGEQQSGEPVARAPGAPHRPLRSQATPDVDGASSGGALPDAAADDAGADAFDADQAPDRDGGESKKKAGSDTVGRARAARQLYFEATLRMEAPKPEATIAKVAAYTTKAGGYVEEQAKDQITVRLPGAGFLAHFASLQKLAKVLDKRLWVDDVTDAYSDLAQRRQILTEALHRYQALAASARTAAEKLLLLQEMGRLRERLEALEAALASVEKMAKFSRLTVAVEARNASLGAFAGGDLAAFAWITKLNPDSDAVAASGKRFDLRAPKGFVVVADKDYWIAESATKARLRSTRLANEPRGDSAFWQEALYHRMAKLSGFKAKRYASGHFRGVRLTALGQDTSVYIVAVRAKGDSLFVTEASFPTAADERAHLAPVGAVLAKWKGE